MKKPNVVQPVVRAGRRKSAAPFNFTLCVQLVQQFTEFHRVAGAQHSLRQGGDFGQAGGEDALFGRKQLRGVHGKLTQAQPEQ